MTTQTNRLLHALWTGEVTPVPQGASHAVFDILEGLFRAQMLVIEVPAGPLCGRVLQETTELMPDLPVADVLEEELNINVPAGAVIICLSNEVLGAASELGTVSRVLGAITAQIIVDAVQLSVAPLSDERKAMRQLAQIINIAARELAALQGQLDYTEFKTALALEFARVLEGAATVGQSDAALVARFAPDGNAIAAPETAPKEQTPTGSAGIKPADRAVAAFGSFLADPARIRAAGIAMMPPHAKKV